MKIFNKKNVALFFLCLSLFFITSISLYAIISYNKELSSRHTLSKSIKESETRLVALEKRMLEDNFNMLIGDMLTFTAIAEEAIKDGKDEPLPLRRLERYFAYIIKNKKNYDQLRFLDTSGNELARVDYKNNNAVITQKQFLQNKKSRYYFEEAMNLKRGQVYISKLDLNFENGKFEEPKKPVIRLATKIFDKNGNAKGIIIANFYAEIMLSNYKDIAKTSHGYVHLINNDGYWISNDENPNTEFAFMYDDMQNVKFENKYPEKWKQILKSGKYIDDKNKYYSEEIIPFDNINKREFLIAKEDIIFSGGNFISMVHISKETMPKAFVINFWQHLREDIIKNSSLILFLFILSTSFSLMLILYNIQKGKIKYYSQYDPLTSVYNRRTGINKIMKIIRETRHRNSVIAIIFIDINGLKEVNDNLGHKYGDLLIKRTAKIISDAVRNHDILFRYGGDEFIICLKNVQIDIVNIVWKRIMAKIDIENEFANNPFKISLSHGISLIYPDADVNDIKPYISEADKNMYEEKMKLKKLSSK